MEIEHTLRIILKELLRDETTAAFDYNLYAEALKQDNCPEIASIMQRHSTNEKEHAEVLEKELGKLVGEASMLRATIEDELAAARRYLEAAEECGNTRLAKVFRNIAEVEQSHANELLSHAGHPDVGTPVCDLQNGKYWRCTKCGNLYLISDLSKPKESLPEICEICGHKEEDFELVDIGYNNIG